MGRGPSYPYVDLEQGVLLARKLYDFAKRSPAPVDSVITDAWNYSATSSSGQKVLAALKAFDLIEEAPGNNGKTIKLTNRAIRILLDDPSSPERIKAVKEAAVSPKWYEYCWRTWGPEMPPSMRSNLLIEHGFVDTTVDSFLRDYKKSIAFAGLKGEQEPKDMAESNVVSTEEWKVGDLVQWESQGVWQFPTPKRIREFSEEKDYAFVEGSNTGIPVDQLLRAVASSTDEVNQSKPPQQCAPAIQAPLVASGPIYPNVRQDVFSLTEGTVSIQWPASLSPDSYQDVIDWLEILKRKIGRSVENKMESKATNG